MASNSNSNYKAKTGSLKSPQVQKQTSTPKQATTTTTSTTTPSSTTQTNKPTYTQTQVSTKTQTNTQTTTCNPRTGTTYKQAQASTPAYTQTQTSTQAQTNSIPPIKKNTSYTNNNTPIINYMMQENKTEELNLSTTEPQKIDISNVNLDRISVSSDSALSEKFVKVNKDIWNKANLVAINKGNGTFLIKNGDVPI